jgi:hypothetical protein
VISLKLVALLPNWGATYADFAPDLAKTGQTGQKKARRPAAGFSGCFLRRNVIC